MESRVSSILSYLVLRSDPGTSVKVHFCVAIAVGAVLSISTVSSIRRQIDLYAAFTPIVALDLSVYE